MRCGLEVGPADAGPTVVQPLPRVEPAFDLAGLLVEFDASVFPAFDSAALEGLGVDFAAFAIICSFTSMRNRSCELPSVGSRDRAGAIKVDWSAC